MTSPGALLEVRDLAICFDRAANAKLPVDGVHLDVQPGETVGIMGDSGAGKTLTALALLRLLPAGARIVRGSIRWRGRDVLAMPEAELRALRGREIGIGFQDPNTSLHPIKTVGQQVAEALTAHDHALPRRTALERATGLLERMGVPADRATRGGYPFEWSGGMRQRAVLAMALANSPQLLVADEITTALDVITQARILDQLREIQRRTGTAILLITHDAAVIAEMADRVVVMREGRVVESGDVRQILRAPREAHTRGLIAAVAAPGSLDHGVAAHGAELLRVEGLCVRYRVRTRFARSSPSEVRAVDDVSLHVYTGETLGIVGESGSGKSTLARAILRLEETRAGRIILAGQDITRSSGPSLRTTRRKVQIVFQDPFASLNPRRRIGASIAEPMRIHGLYKNNGSARVREMLERVGLPPEFATRFPHQLSGGERQRVAIARALAVDPALLVLDEPVSSLDSRTRNRVLELLHELQHSLGLSYVFIAHDLRVVQGLAHRVAVMQQGRIVEVGETAEVFRAPAHPYTRALLASIPSLEPRVNRASADEAVGQPLDRADGRA